MKKIYLKIVFLIFISHGFTQTINRSKRELSTPKNSTRSTTTSSSSTTTSGNSQHNPELVLLFFRVFGYATFGILVGDYANEEHLRNDLNSHPYSAFGFGNYVQKDFNANNNFRLDLENKFLTAGNTISANHLDVKIRPSKYFYFSTDWYQLSEYNTFTKKRDNLSLHYFNFAYDRIRMRDFNLGWTIGASYVGNEVQKTGFSYGLNAEYFLGSNLSIAADCKLSTINNFPVNSYTLKGKYFKENYFATIGYEQLKIATPIYNFISIGAGIYF